MDAQTYSMSISWAYSCCFVPFSLAWWQMCIHQPRQSPLFPIINVVLLVLVLVILIICLVFSLALTCWTFVGNWTCLRRDEWVGGGELGHDGRGGTAGFLCVGEVAYTCGSAVRRWMLSAHVGVALSWLHWTRVERDKYTYGFVRRLDMSIDMSTPLTVRQMSRHDMTSNP